MKRLFLIFLFSLIAYPAWGNSYFPWNPLRPETVAYFLLPGATGNKFTINDNIKNIQYGNGYSASLTAIMTTVSPMMVTMSSVDLRPYIGYYATFSDGSKTATVKLGAVGTGTTYGASMNVSNCANSGTAPYNTFDGASPTGFHAIVSSGASHKAGTADEITLTTGKLLNIAFTIAITGSEPTMGARDTIDSSNYSYTGAIPVKSGNKDYYRVPTVDSTGVIGFSNGSGATNFTISNLAVRYVLTPDSSGCTTSDLIDKGINADAITSVTISRKGARGVLLGDSFTVVTTSSLAAEILLTAGNTGAYVVSSGVNGNLIADGNTRYTADVTPQVPKFVIIQLGMNDIDGALTDPEATMESGMQAIVAKVLADGAIPIICGVSPFKTNVTWNSDRQGWLDAWNTWIAAYCVSNGYQYVDFYTLLEDPGTADTLLALYDSGDGKHPNQAGKAVLAAAIATAINTAMNW